MIVWHHFLYPSPLPLPVMKTLPFVRGTGRAVCSPEVGVTTTGSPYRGRAAGALIVMSLACALTGYGSSLIVNGSFETGNFVPNAQDTMTLGLGATDMAGWVVTDAPLAWIGPANPFGLSASDGSYFLDLSGYHDNAPYAGVAQTVPIATVVGATYRVSFDLGTDPAYNPAPVSIVVSVGSGAGLVSATFTSTPSTPNRWESFSFDYVASATTTPISFTGTAGADYPYIGLDNVDLSLVVIPEPSALALGGLGLVSLAFFRRRT